MFSRLSFIALAALVITTQASSLPKPKVGIQCAYGDGACTWIKGKLSNTAQDNCEPYIDPADQCPHKDAHGETDGTLINLFFEYTCVFDLFHICAYDGNGDLIKAQSVGKKCAPTAPICETPA